MTRSTSAICLSCGATLAPGARFCPNCGTPAGDLPDEVLLAGSRRLKVSAEALSLRELMAVVEAGVSWWQQRLADGDSVGRERAAAAIKELSGILASLAAQLAQGRETVRITSRLPAIREYGTACPVCGRGNRPSARFCLSCGAALDPAARAKPGPPPQPRRPSLAVATRTDVGRVRPINEDSIYTGKLSNADGLEATLLIVADGMGGAQAGEEASQLAVETFKRELVATLQQGTPSDAAGWQALLRAAAQAANARVYDQARANPAKRGMGTTLTVALVVGEAAHLAQVGDSRAYLINPTGVTEDGELSTQLTSDHSLVARLVDIGQLTPAQARSHPQRNMLYRALGTDPTVEVDTSSQPLEPGDILLLCSDGLYGDLEDEELARIVLAESEGARAVERLVALAKERGGKDNISLIVARFG